MTNTSDVTLGFEPEDLSGHTIEELAEYLEAGRNPQNASIEQSPGCQLALEALTRLHRLTTEMIDEDTALEETDESWVEWILSGIALDVRAGRRIPYRAAQHDLAITEGAVRGLVRRAEESLPGVVIGRCRLGGDVEIPGAETTVTIEVCMPFGHSIEQLAARLRGRVLEYLAQHTDLAITAVDIVVTDIQAEWREGGEM